MKVQILEKVSHHSKSPEVQKLHRRDRELFWIKELGTAAPYDCNNQVKGVGILTSPSSHTTNVFGLFNQKERRKRSHGRRHYSKKPLSKTLVIDYLLILLTLCFKHRVHTRSKPNYFHSPLRNYTRCRKSH